MVGSWVNGFEHHLSHIGVQAFEDHDAIRGFGRRMNCRNLFHLRALYIPVSHQHMTLHPIPSLYKSQKPFVSTNPRLPACTQLHFHSNLMLLGPQASLDARVQEYACPSLYLLLALALKKGPITQIQLSQSINENMQKLYILTPLLPTVRTANKQINSVSLIEKFSTRGEEFSIRREEKRGEERNFRREEKRREEQRGVGIYTYDGNVGSR